MKCLILLTFVALCYSYPYGYTRNYRVNQDGSVSTTTSDGRRLTLYRGLGQDTDRDVVVVSEYEKFNRNPFYEFDTLDRQRLGELTEVEDQRLPLQTQERNLRYLVNSFRNPFQREDNLVEEQDRRQELQELQQVLQQQRRSQYPYRRTYDNENNLRFDRDQDVLEQDRFTSRVSVRDQLSQVIEGEREILDRQDQIQQQQLRQQRQQQRLLEQQQQQEEEQRRQQVQQRNLQEVQEQVLREQEQVLGEQQKVEQQQERQLQQERYAGLRSVFDDVRSFVPSGQSQQRPGVYSLRELYGGYGQGVQRRPIFF